MAIWPFGRRSKKKTASTDKSPRAPTAKPPEGSARDRASEASDVNSSTAGGKPGRKSSQRRSSRKLTKVPQSKMKDPEKIEKIETALTFTQPNLKRQPGKNEKPETRQLSTPSKGRADVPSYYFQNPASLTSLQPENFTAFPLPPTLRAKKHTNDSNFLRRKSSKRKAEDQAREQEIKAMSSPIPIPKRPGSRGAAGLRDSRRGFNSSTRNLQRPLSEVSLPLPESIKSTMSVVSDSHGFRVSALDALAPRPTIRYFESPRNKEVGSGTFGPVRTATKKERQALPPAEDGLKPNQRIAHLADDLDAGSIRELMDRDQRRSERNRRAEQEKLQRKLQRKADSQRATEAADEERVDGPSKENIAPVAREIQGLGLEGFTSPTEAAVGLNHSPVRDQGTATPESWSKGQSRPDMVLGNVSNGRVGIVAPDERTEPILETAKVVRLSQASLSPPFPAKQAYQEPSSLSLLADLGTWSPPGVQGQETSRRESDMSGRLSNNWASIFRRSGTRRKESPTDRGRLSPSEFSNTSRESFTRPTASPSAFARIPPARSGTPVRTQSRFKEDLPEHPLSPPDSRMQSPEALDQDPQKRSDPRGRDGSDLIGKSAISDPQMLDIHPAFRDEILLNRNQPGSYPSPEIPSSAILSQSLASVDSEGSWLTGRPMKRTSPTFHTPLRGSASSLQRSRDVGASDDEVGDGQEEMSRVTPEVGERSKGDPTKTYRYLSGSAGSGGSDVIGGDSDDDMAFDSEPPAIPLDEGKWHRAVGKHPTIVRQGAIAKSREGLLDDFQAAEDSVESSPSGDSPMGHPFEDQPTPPEIYRAKSVDLGKGHARHMSAGSARLLDLPPRSSVELKRLSTASGERSPRGIGKSMPLATSTNEEGDEWKEGIEGKEAVKGPETKKLIE